MLAETTPTLAAALTAADPAALVRTVLLEALAERGWSAQDLGALTSGNIRRVLGDAEDVADGRDEPRRH